MIEGYLTIKQVAEKWGVTRRRVQTLCSQGRIPGATDNIRRLLNGRKYEK